MQCTCHTRLSFNDSMTRLLAQPSYDVSGNDFTVTGIAKVGVTVHLIVKIADLSFSDSNEQLNTGVLPYANLTLDPSLFSRFKCRASNLMS